jgi:hypothetical protein
MLAEAAMVHDGGDAGVPALAKIDPFRQRLLSTTK